ncbi:MAG: hypothetical protein Unbinned4098contig1000_5 [Prokaryotic dsDNA virus sp.]|mgnify:CR=1 FL=1|nr:MAG: hypothetical protein Unbinned4098contig1000_5 [Prokaryotic dsDNA virus sp.]|tara:strand:+ start:6466 stop:6870 length:405 start_codon:yes stop_codon:yes gene_type:complete
MVKLIAVDILEAVANTVADTGFDFGLTSRVMKSYSTMNISAYVYDNDLRFTDFPSPEELVNSIIIKRRRYDVERRVSYRIFDKLKEGLIASDGKDFSLFYMDEILDAMQELIYNYEQELKELEECYKLRRDAEE